MANKTTLAMAGAAMLAAGEIGWGSNARADETVAGTYCASGYRPDARGDCQPDGAVVYGPCQPGFHYQVFPNGNGYRCAPDGY